MYHLAEPVLCRTNDSAATFTLAAPSIALYAPSSLRETFIRVADARAASPFPPVLLPEKREENANHERNVPAKAFEASKEAMFPFFFARQKWI